MATGVHLYTSTDAAAPIVTGQAGAATALLDAILVDGYGALPAAGWSRTYSASNKRLFQQGAGPGLYLRCHDDASGAGGAQEALIRMAEGATDIDTLTYPMPTDAQSALTDHSLVIRKSATADATARPWIAVADDRTILLAVLAGDISLVYWTSYMGDYCSFLPADAFRNAICTRAAENVATDQIGSIEHLQPGTFTTPLAGHFLQRNRNGLAGAINCQCTDVAGAPAVSSQSASASYVPYPNPADGSLILRRLFLHDPSTAPVTAVQGYLRGVWAIGHNQSNFADRSTYGGVGDYTGRTFTIVRLCGNAGALAIETSDTWDTSS